MKKWTDAQRDEALAIYRVDGPSEAARRTGIPRPTITSWACRNGEASLMRENLMANVLAQQLRWAERRESMVHEMGDVAQKALTKAGEAIDADKLRDAKDAATTMAILVDKAQLLSGGATSRPAFDPQRVIEQAKAKVVELVPQRRTG
jgi:hypothetical protein